MKIHEDGSITYESSPDVYCIRVGTYTVISNGGEGGVAILPGQVKVGDFDTLVDWFSTHIGVTRRQTEFIKFSPRITPVTMTNEWLEYPQLKPTAERKRFE